MLKKSASKRKRRFLQIDERIYFNKRKRFIIERYFEKEKFSFDTKFFLRIDYGIPPTPNNLKVTFVYRDSTLIEYATDRNIKIPDPNEQTGRCEFELLVPIQEDSKILYTIKFETLSLTDTSLYIRIFD